MVYDTARLFVFVHVKVTYTAIDGKTFETENDCVKHEEFLLKRSDLIKDMIFSHLQDIGEESLLEVIRLFDEKIGFRAVEGLWCKFANIFDMYSACFDILKTGAPGEIETAERQIGHIMFKDRC